MTRIKYLFSLFFIFSTSVLLGQWSPEARILLEKFKQPETPIAVYWYWLNDHLSPEGVEKDLEAMKAAGINRAFIGFIQIEGLEQGSSPLFSDSWWKTLHTALKKAAALGIEIGIFNSPGWSQSGGPWVKPEQSMRYLHARTWTVKEGESWAMPKDSHHVFKVIAYPQVKNYGVVRARGKGQTRLLAPGAARSLVLRPVQPVDTRVKIYEEREGKLSLWREVEVARKNQALNVGFDPQAPVIIGLPQKSHAVYVVESTEEMQYELTEEVLLERYAEKSLAKMFPTPLPLWQDYLWPEVSAETQGAIPENEVIEIAKSGTFIAKGGTWEIQLLEMRSTGVENGPAAPSATGLETDKMSKRHIAAHFDAFIGKILEKIPAQDRSTFKVVVQDSYETGGQNWTDDMHEAFTKAYRYDPLPYLPVLSGKVVGSPDRSERFLWDLRRLIADRVAYDYVGGLREKAHAAGLTTWLENYGHWGFPSEFMMYGGQSDEISGEYWSEGSLGDIENRAAASTAHVYGKEKVWAESFTAAGKEFWRYPYLMKERGDRFFAEGINASLLHLYIHQPYEDRWPGLNAWFGNEFNRKNTWFSHMDLFTQYLKRSNYLLQQGRYVADVAVFIGEDVPKMTGPDPKIVPQGYSFDYINAEALLNLARVENGELVLKSGMRYKELVLPEVKTMRPELARALVKFAESGLRISGTVPSRAPGLEDYPQADREVKEWGSVLKQRYGVQEGPVAATLMPDFTADVPLRFLHRTSGALHWYFLANPLEKKQVFHAFFRVEGLFPWWVDVLSGEIRPLPEFTQVKGGTTLPLELDAWGSGFVFWDTKAHRATGKNVPTWTAVQDLSTGWQATFTAMDGRATFQHDFASLEDWSKVEQTKYFSGRARYTKTFYAEADAEYDLDLGPVMMAKVKVNDQPQGGVWAPPYRVKVKVKKGENTLEVDVVNTWNNALVGDRDQRFWAPINGIKSTSPLQSSGLIGPVRLLKQID